MASSWPANLSRRIDLAHTRLLNQQLLSPLFESPADAVAHMGVMQAQEYRQMRWAVAMRTRTPSLQAFQSDYNSGRIVRLHLLRGTWQLVSGDDYWWMLGLCASKAESVIRGWMHANRIDLPEAEILHVRNILGQTTADLGSATKEDYAEALAIKGITMDDHRLSYHIRMAELCGLLCSGNLHPSKATYAIAANKVGPASVMSRDEALSLLARKYFQSHAPATLDDFAWWCGLPLRDCRRAADSLAPELRSELFDGQEFLFLDSCRSCSTKAKANLLLPAYDEYLIGYKSRHIAIAPHLAKHAYSNNGIFHPVISTGGTICGNWKPFGKAHQPSFFLAEAETDTTREWQRYINFLNR